MSVSSLGWLLPAIAVIAVIIAAVVIVKKVARAARRTVNRAETQLVKELFEAATDGGAVFDSTPQGPKKVSNMNKIYLPLITKDFPSFNWSETRLMVEDAVKEHYAGKKTLSVHDTAIARYEKTGGSVTLHTESSVSYDENGGKRYAIAQATLSYIRYGNDSDAPQGEHALNCPNCSAPLSRNAAGELLCEYCGTLVTGEKSWQITDIREESTR